MGNRTLQLTLTIAGLSCVSELAFTAGQEVKALAADPILATSTDETTPPVLLSEADITRCPYSLISDVSFTATTSLHARIDPAGHPTEVLVTASSGSPTLDAAAVACFEKAQFRAAMRAGKPVVADFQLQVKWNVPASAETCSTSMPRAAMLEVQVSPSPTEPGELPPTGVALACVCFGGKGSSQPIILRSSGNQRLDAGAIKFMEIAAEKGRGNTGCIALEMRFVAAAPPNSPGASKQRIEERDSH